MLRKLLQHRVFFLIIIVIIIVVVIVVMMVVMFLLLFVVVDYLFVTRLKTDVGSKYAEVEQVAREDLNIILERYHRTGTCTANKWDTGTLA